jgi:actin-like ATPase involved in cell morphogenesis
MSWFNFFTQEIAIDLGTANTLIIHNDKVVVDEPSIVAMDRTTGKVIAVGDRPSRCMARPMRTSRPSGPCAMA